MFHLICVIVAIESVFSSGNFFPSEVDDRVEIVDYDNQFPLAKTSENIENYPLGNKNDPVRRFLKHYNSLRPIAILVDDSPENHWATRNFMKNVFNTAPSAKLITYFISKFNESGAGPLIEIPGTEAGRIDETLVYKTPKETSYLGPRKGNGTSVFYAILNAAAALPHDGAIFAFLDRRSNDEDLASHTGIIRKKNIKVYVLWGGPYPSKSNEERLLNELCTYSGGLFLTNDSKNLSNYYYRQFIERGSSILNTSIVLSKTNLTGQSEFTFPIDIEVTGIHLTLTPGITKGTLSPPKGSAINILMDNQIAAYGSGSFGFTESGQREVYLDTTSTQSVGFWRLELDSTQTPYNVTVFLYTKLTAHAYFLRKNAGTEDATSNKRNIMKLDFTGYVGSINNISFVDNKGQPITDGVKFNVMKDLLVMENDSDNRKKEIDVEVINVPRQPFHVVIQGKDVQGNQFSRITYVNDYTYTNIFPQPILSIDVGLGSELITTAGRSPVITFEVSNFRNTAADVRFFCKDEQSILGTMQPYRQIISPQQTTVVRLTLVPKMGSYQDTITFTASVGSEAIEKKVLVDVGMQEITDTTSPSLDYSYLSDCSKVLFTSCDQGTWTIEVKAKDTGSGLLQVTSNPKGLYFANGYTSGTKEEVTGSYSDSCCNADIQVTALDRMNNRRSINANAYRATWSAGQISALVLGIILLILLIVLVIYLVRKCLKKKENYDLPTYRGGSSRSRI